MLGRVWRALRRSISSLGVHTEERPRVLVYYFPNYHPADASSPGQKGAGWSEWQVVGEARPRFPGHQQPKRPLWGPTDESDPRQMARKIDAAADHGVDAFIFDWYYYDDGPFLDRCLDAGYLGAPNHARLKFALLWANHDWPDVHPARRGQPRVLRPGRVKPETFFELGRRVISKYLTHPSYLRVDGRPFFSIYEPGKLVESFGSVAAARGALQWFRREARAAGVKRLHLNGLNWSVAVLPGEEIQTGGEELLADLELDSTTSYVWLHHVRLPLLETDYREVCDRYFAHWEEARRRLRVPFLPNVTMGWDPSPRAHPDDAFQPPDHYPFTNTISGNTPERFRAALQVARQKVAALHPSVRLVTINAWNEWTEGSYLEPDAVHGLGYLEAVRDVFGRQGRSGG